MYEANAAREKTVLIVGAGPTGLTLAIDLSRRKISCRLIEAAEAPFAGSRGKGIQPRTLEIFDELGIVEPILEAGGLYPKLRFHLGPFSMRAGSLGSSKPPTGSTPYPNLWMVPQSSTEAILRQRLHTLGGRVEFNRAIATLRQDQEGVTATLSNGEEVHCDYLIGCDGGRSTVRKQLGLTLEGEVIDEDPMLVADVEIEGFDRNHNDWHVWPFSRGGAIGLCPLPRTTLFQLTGKAETLAPDLEAAVHRATRLRVKRIAWRSTYQPAVRMVNRYRIGRVFLAGDAGHVHPPAGGQGLNTGVQDSYNLGWKLAHVLRGGPDSLLDSYESERLPIAAAVLGLSKRLHRSPSIKRGDATNQLALHYRGSSLSSGNALGSLHPGDRMPDIRFADGSRLFEHMRGPHSTEVATLEGPRILIRPDGYIAYIGGKKFTEYAGEPTHSIQTAVAIPSRGSGSI
jgi:2-polyprenyl-6-methoxyphenol hydroxylase-like FAD-dependent oxidoreductase